MTIVTISEVAKGGQCIDQCLAGVKPQRKVAPSPNPARRLHIGRHPRKVYND